MFGKSYFTGIILIFLMFFTTILIRHDSTAGNAGIENIQATYHSLLTINSLSSLPIKESFLLPTVNFSGDINKNVPWAASLITRDGNYVYTSFPSFGFIAPYIIIRALGGALNLESLLLVNYTFLLLTMLLFYTSLYIISYRNKESERTSVFQAVAGCSVMAFSAESLISSGLVYWPQSLSQLLLSVILLILCLRNNKHKAAINISLFIAVFLISWTEWTGYVFSAAFLLYSSISRYEHWKRFSIISCVASFAAAVVYIVQIHEAIDFQSFLKTSLERYASRGTSNANFLMLLYGYWISFGTFTIFALTSPLFLKNRNTRFIMVICLIPLIENLLLASHATSFTFDRWKLAFPIGLSIALTLNNFKKQTAAIIALLFISSSIGVTQYNKKIGDFGPWASVDKKNHLLANEAVLATNMGCTKIYTDTQVRGYTVMLFMRSVYEGMPTHPNDVMSSENDVCSVIIVRGVMFKPDIPEFKSIEVWKRGVNSPLVFN